MISSLRSKEAEGLSSKWRLPCLPAPVAFPPQLQPPFPFPFQTALAPGSSLPTYPLT